MGIFGNDRDRKVLDVPDASTRTRERVPLAYFDTVFARQGEQGLREMTFRLFEPPKGLSSILALHGRDTTAIIKGGRVEVIFREAVAEAATKHWLRELRDGITLAFVSDYNAHMRTEAEFVNNSSDGLAFVFRQKDGTGKVHDDVQAPARMDWHIAVTLSDGARKLINESADWVRVHLVGTETRDVAGD